MQEKTQTNGVKSSASDFGKWYWTTGSCHVLFVFIFFLSTPRHRNFFPKILLNWSSGLRNGERNKEEEKFSYSNSKSSN